VDSDRHRSEPKNLYNNWDSSESKSKDALPSHSAVLSGENFYQDADVQPRCQNPVERGYLVRFTKDGVEGLICACLFAQPRYDESDDQPAAENVAVAMLPGSFDRKLLFPWRRDNRQQALRASSGGLDPCFVARIVQ
jgi:hypothetical protein